MRLSHPHLVRATAALLATLAATPALGTEPKPDAKASSAEVHRVVERFGPLVHVFSTYEGRREGDARPFVRGINSIQAMHDGKRWRLLTVAWAPETPDQPLPAKYLPPVKR